MISDHHTQDTEQMLLSEETRLMMLESSGVNPLVSEALYLRAYLLCTLCGFLHLVLQSLNVFVVLLKRRTDCVLQDTSPHT